MTNDEIIAEFYAHVIELDVPVGKALDTALTRAREQVKFTRYRAPQTETFRGLGYDVTLANWKLVVPAVMKLLGVRVAEVVGHRAIRCHCDARHVAWHVLHALGTNQTMVATVVNRHQNVVGKGITRINRTPELRAKAEQIAAQIREDGRVKP